MFEKRRNRVVASINAIPGLSCVTPKGAFYAFVNCRKLIGKRTPSGDVLKHDSDLAMYLLREAGVAVVPGSAFLREGYFRLSFAASEADLARACALLERAVECLSSTPEQ